MGERLSGDGIPGRRHVPPAAPADARPALDEAGLQALLAATIRVDGVDAEAEGRAVAAFRAARDAGAHQARTRRRDDWRPRGQRGLARSMKATLSLIAASLALGGVAFAAIGSAGSAPEDPAGERRGGTPSAATTDRLTAGPSGTTPGTATARPDRPLSAADTEAHCRAYERVEGRGKALDSTAWQRLVAAAGGADEVAAYCAEHQDASRRSPGPQHTAAPDRPEPAATGRPTDAGAQAEENRPDKGTDKKNGN
ncbi:hypothetical protein ACWC10_33690 [Streptomyces sp. NPDC001595]|uniref:hypothetical protein n=1 Tax=Streptomyces sp. NPDC001532 TaxID=3154520 RepID=UPI00331897D7